MPGLEVVRPAAPEQNSRARPLLILLGCLSFLGVLGWVDFITGYELGFFVFYSAPVGLAAWYLGRWPGVFLAAAASATWWLADFYSGEKYSARFYYYWNTGIHLLGFLINAVTIAKIKTELDKRHVLAAELEATRSALERLRSQVPTCPACGRPEEGAAGQAEPPC